MNRRDVIRGIGAISLLAVTPKFGTSQKEMDEPSNDELLKSSCSEAPAETAGPYPLPSSVSSSGLVRSDITENSQTGIPLTMTFTLVNVDDNCALLEGYRVDIWHCNTRGYYSAYDGQPGIDGTVNNGSETWLRGIQYSDSNGQVTFTSIYPGWYMPRATHIHVQVFDASNQLLVTTQLAFPDAINTTVNSYYATSGTNSFTNTNDMVFSDSYTEELMTVTGSTTNGYVATKEIGISAGVASIDTLAPESGLLNELSLFPVPAKDWVTLKCSLSDNAIALVTIYDNAGGSLKKVAVGQLSKGQNTIPITVEELAEGTYFLEVQLSNVTGIFKQKMVFIKNS